MAEEKGKSAVSKLSKDATVEVLGDSMYPKYKKGDILIISNIKEGNPRDYAGEVCEVSYQGESMLRQIVVDSEGGVQLQSPNAYIPTIQVNSKEGLVVQSVVVGFYRPA